jgi:hypothetical protein
MQKNGLADNEGVSSPEIQGEQRPAKNVCVAGVPSDRIKCVKDCVGRAEMVNGFREMQEVGSEFAGHCCSW